MLVIYKKSLVQIYIRERKNVRIRRLLEEGGPIAKRLHRAHKEHVDSLEEAKNALKTLGARAVFRYRSDLSNAGEFDLVVTLGGDGTLLWASHLVGSDVPIVAINTSPADSVGHFCAGTKDNLVEVLGDAISGKLKETRLFRMRVEVDGDVVTNRVLNDALFCHKCPAATTRYLIRVANRHEEHKSSGIWIGPAAGSTGAQRSAGGRILPKSSKRLQFVVRELCLPNNSGLQLRRGFIEPGQSFHIQSRIRAGHLYIDGPHLARGVGMGSELSMRSSDEPLVLLGFSH
ncbi:MAG: NAD(+)/NADH kinase [Deltaproteobacteria bacterium]|nr:NAD(+)/NADH kinase [Deltaproteobacteria bacterium]